MSPTIRTFGGAGGRDVEPGALSSAGRSQPGHEETRGRLEPADGGANGLALRFVSGNTHCVGNSVANLLGSIDATAARTAAKWPTHVDFTSRTILDATRKSHIGTLLGSLGAEWKSRCRSDQSGRARRRRSQAAGVELEAAAATPLVGTARAVAEAFAEIGTHDKIAYYDHPALGRRLRVGTRSYYKVPPTDRTTASRGGVWERRRTSMLHLALKRESSGA